MKPFNLKEALSGKPVKLRNGCKAYVLCDLRDLFAIDCGSKRCLIGVYSVEGNPSAFEWVARWKLSGKYYERIQESEYDIVGMWEEPKLTTEEIMEKAFREELILRHPTLPTERRGFRVVGKTVGNDYILQDCDRGDMYFASVFNENIEWIIKD